MSVVLTSRTDFALVVVIVDVNVTKKEMFSRLDA